MEKTHFAFQGLVVLICIAYAVQSASLLSNTVYFTERCQKAKIIKGNYTPRGSEYEIGNLTVYESANRSAKRLLIAIYDIYGSSDNMKEVVDTIADMYDFRVVMPDVFRGHPWDDSNFPPEDPQDLIDFLATNGSWDKVVKYDVSTVINEFQSKENITEVAIFGMCYGGLISTRAAQEVPQVKGAGLVHPSFITDNDALTVRAPTYLLPASDDPDMLPFYEILKEKFGNNTGHRRFDDMVHGFAAARGNFSDPLTRQRVNEVIDILGTFFDSNLRNY